MEKKKLLVTASTFPRWKGDTEPRFVLDLTVHMTDKYEVTVLVPATPGAEEREKLEGVNVIRYHYLPIHKWETLCYPGAIVPRIKEKKARILQVPFLFIALYFHLFKLLPQFDIVHAHWLIPQGIVQSFFKKPYIVTGHGGDVMSLNKGLFRKLKIRCLKRAKRVAVVSKHLKSKVQELLPEIAPDIISMGVDLSKFGKQYYVPDYFGQRDKKVVLFVGRLVEIKGVTYLIKAMKDIDALLVIVGDGPLRKELEKQALEINGKVIFLGAKSHEELKPIYASADIFVCPSITVEDGGQEGMPTVLLEAMASQIPIVATNTGGISQLIQDNVYGLLCEEKNIQQLTNCINDLIFDKQLYQRIIDNINGYINQFDYDCIAKKYKELLD